MRFVAIDVETANPDMASICQVGIVACENGKLSDEWKTYVDPEDYFDGFNVSIHGIDESVVDGAPTFADLADTIRSRLDGKVVVCHTHFDRVAMCRAAQRYGLSAPDWTWLDSASVARRAWNECARRGYGLLNVCQIIGYQFKPHDALEDAKAAAQVLLAASEKCGFDIDAWLKRVRQPIDLTKGRSYSHSHCEKIERDGNPEGALYGEVLVFSHSHCEKIERDGNPEGALYGEVLVFTGALEIPRREAADLAAVVGCRVATRVTKETTLLVVGDQDIRRLAGHEKSSKHRKADELIKKGVPIRILQESDFRELVRSACEPSESITE